MKNTDGLLVPNVSTCAKANFPAEAKEIVHSAEVLIRLVVDKTGRVIETKSISVELIEVLDPSRAKSTIPYFEEAGRKAFGDRKCPVYYRDDVPVGYGMEVPLKYVDGPGGPRAKVYLKE